MATAMAGTETGIDETRHAGRTYVLVKGGGDVLTSPNGPACSGVGLLPLHHLCARGWVAGGAAAVPLPRGLGTAGVLRADRCVDPPFPRFV